jgi:hypothetical protein
MVPVVALVSSWLNLCHLVVGASPSFGYAVLAVCQSAELCSQMSVFTYLKTENCYMFCSSWKADLYGFMEALMFTPRLTMPYRRCCLY